MLTFEQVVADSQLECPLGLLNQLTEVESFELARVRDLSVLKFSLELKEDNLGLFSPFFRCNWNRLDQHMMSS